MTHQITDEQIAQAVARGWCHPSNSGKEMDADLARAISDEVRAVLALAAPQGEPVAPNKARWCQYVAGMISGWLEMARPQIMSMGDEARTKAIAGLIERRLWAMPKDTAPAPAPAVPSVSFDSEQKGTK